MKKKALLYIVLAGLLWGTSGLFFHWLSPMGFTPLQMTAMRGVVAGVVMLLYVALTNPSLFRIRKKEILPFLFSGLTLYGTAACYYAAIEASAVSTAVILMYTAPIFVMVFSVFFFREKLNVPKVLALVMVMLGCVLVSGVLNSGEFNPLGVCLGLAAGLLYSAYNIVAKISMNNRSHPLTASLYGYLVMGVVGLAACRPGEMITLALARPASAIPLMLAIGVFTFVLPYLLYTLALRDIPAGTAACLSMTEPMAATVFSILFLGEELSLSSALGILLILGAVFILNRYGIDEQKEK